MGKVGTPRAHNMIGVKSGKLEVIQRAGKRGTMAMWLCSCLCGGQTFASTSDLRRGKRKSCGCVRKDFRPKLEPTVGVDPAVRFLFRQMNADKMSQRELCRRAGLTEQRLQKWRLRHTTPGITDLRAALGALGYKLKILEDVE